MTNYILDGRYGNTFDKVNTKLWAKVINGIWQNNTFCPDITRVIYSLGAKSETDKKGKKTGKTYPVLGCTVFFEDNTKVTVTNSVNDKVDVVEVNGVKTASEQSKEIALVYAICKKLVGGITEEGEVLGNGYGKFLRTVVANAWDQNVEAAKAKKQKEESKARAEAAKKSAKPKAKRESLAKTVDRLAAAVEKLEAGTASANFAERARDARGRFI